MLQLEDFALHDQLNQQRNKDNNMPVPIIAAAAAVAARLATKKLAQGAAKKVLPNTIRVSAADRKRIAARKAAANPKKASRPATKIGNEPVSKNNTGKLMEPKSNVTVKPARKPVGNPVNQEKSIESMISSVSRGGLKTGGTLGKGRDHRVAKSKQLKWEPNSRKVLDEIAAMKKTKTVKINTNSTKPKGVFGPLKKKLAEADTPANRAKAVNNTRGLKAANKPVSKNNRNRFGDGEMPSYLKSIPPLRANRTRLGNTAKKSK